MKKNLLITTALAGATILGTGIGIVHADTSSSSGSASTNSQSPADRIARYTLEDEHTQAVAKVLNTTPSALEDKLKTETMQQVIKDAGLTDSSFRDKVKAQVQSDLLAKGYTQAQIDNTMDHHKGGMGGHMRRDSDNDGD